MPLDKAGKFHLNAQKAHSSDRAAKPASMPDMPAMPEEPAPHATIHDHGDGTGHTDMADGARHDHADIEGLKAKLDQFFTEESGEGAPMDGSHQMHQHEY